MEAVTPLGQFIADYLYRHNISARELARRSNNISYSSINRAMRNEKGKKKPPKPTIKFVAALSEATNTGLLTLLRLAYPELQIAEPDRTSMLIAERINRLPPAERRIMERFLDTLFE